MATCFICGTERNMSTRHIQGRSICRECSKDTENKISRSAFDLMYWGEGVEAKKIPESTKREFYSDYLSSTGTLEDYMRSTTSEGNDNLDQFRLVDF